MIVVSAVVKEFDPQNLEHANGLREICKTLDLKPMVDLRPYNDMILMSKEGLEKVTRSGIGLAFLSAFCGLHRDQLMEFVLLYNPDIKFDEDIDPEVNKTLKMMRKAIVAYRKQRGSVN